MISFCTKTALSSDKLLCALLPLYRPEEEKFGSDNDSNFFHIKLRTQKMRKNNLTVLESNLDVF